MRTLILLALLGLALAIPPLTEKEYQSQYIAWTRQFGKNYNSVDEQLTRYNIFKSNLDQIRAHNELFGQGKVSFTLAMNQFGDLSNVEYRTQVLSKHTITSGRVARLHRVSNVQAPPSWDWRQNGYTMGVKDQGQCGSCWAFSATAALEHAHQIKNKALVSLSEQLCVDCVNGGAQDCNTGGEMQDCYTTVIKLGGDEGESDYPYTAKSLKVCHFDASKVKAKFSTYYNTTMGDENALLDAAYGHVMSVAIDASNFDFQFYSSGVYDHAGCKTKQDELDHGVAVVGWGNQSGKDYWIVRNSWGASWGASGHILMRRNAQNQCGIATDASYPEAI